MYLDIFILVELIMTLENVEYVLLLHLHGGQRVKSTTSFLVRFLCN